MTNFHGRSGEGELAGSPELFATNLLIVRSIEHNMSGVTIKREKDQITVQNEHPDRSYDSETLTEQLDAWDDIWERFQSMTSFNENDEGILQPQTPATENVKEIKARYPNSETIILSFQYSD